MIDSIVIESKGAYTHDEVFELSLDFAYKLTYTRYEKAMYQQRYMSIEQQLNSKK